MRLRIADGSVWSLETWDRFWSNVDASGDCWEWTGGRYDNGYGCFSNLRPDTKRRTYLSHRESWRMLVGPLTPGLTIDHLCRNRLCVNPMHLEEVTRGANVLRGFGKTAVAAKRTHCKWGHDFKESEDWPDSRGRRRCYLCYQDRLAALRQATRDRGGRPWIRGAQT